MSKKKKSRRSHKTAEPQSSTTRRAKPPLDETAEAIRLCHSAQALLEREQYHQAMMEAKRCLTLAPDESAPLLIYARSSAVAGDPRDAIAAYDRIFEIEDLQDT